MLTSTQIRQSFLDFFREKLHTIVPSSSLMPDSPNLLFTNAGMNQFVPIFLGEKSADVSKWGGAVPGSDTRAADTQKCIRAGGKHNDLDDVGLDTYHHTFFEMLGNWSFGDYFKKEAIEWAWELVVERWKFPANRVYATIYQPDKGDPAERDQEAWELWAEKFRAVGLDPAVHIVNGNKKDNFWMMGETGPCGPCSELHVDLTPAGDTRGLLVNKGTAECIEIWNLVFIQFNANPDGTFSPLPAQHVDTGMGFERVTSIIQGTKGFTDFANAKISNYETDIFRPIFDELEKMSGKRYGSTLPGASQTPPVTSATSGSGTATPASGPATPASPTATVAVAQKGVAAPQKAGAEALAGVATGQKATAAPHAGVAAPEKGVAAEPAGVAAREKAAADAQIAMDVAFRVIADHIRTLSFAIADGIQPGNNDRNYVLRRILRRAVKYGRTLGFHQPFFYKLVGVLAATMGDVFPEIRAKQKHIEETLEREEEAFNRTLDKGILIFDQIAGANAALERLCHQTSELISKAREYRDGVPHSVQTATGEIKIHVEQPGDDAAHKFFDTLEHLSKAIAAFAGKFDRTVLEHALGSAPQWFVEEGRDLRATIEIISGTDLTENLQAEMMERINSSIDLIEDTIPTARDETEKIPGTAAFLLYDTYGFPLDLTELMARERGLTVDNAGFEKLMEEQRARARAAQKRTVIELSEVETKEETNFVGYDTLSTPATVLEVVSLKDKTAVVLSASPCYAEMGGQVGDTGELAGGGQLWRVTNTQKAGHTWLHFIEGGEAPVPGTELMLSVDGMRRAAIQRHHTVTHIMHWALHQIVGKEATQKGSFVGPDKLTFDFNSAALTPKQLQDLEKLVNAAIIDNDHVWWTELPYSDVRGREDVMQFFGDKYGEMVRLVQVAGYAGHFDGYSMELCGGTHVRNTGEIGLFRIVSESAIAAGVRRIEAVAGIPAYDMTAIETRRLHAVAEKLGAPFGEIEKKLEAFLAHEKELEKALKAAQQREAASRAKELLASVETINGTPAIIANLGHADGDTLQTVADALKAGGFQGVTVLGGAANNAVALVANVSADFTAKAQAGKVIQAIAPLVGGKGGGKPDSARGGGKDVAKLDEALAKAKALL